MDSREAFAVPLIVGCLTGVSGWVVTSIATNIRRAKAARHVAELHGKLVEKFGSSQELIAYVESDAGRRMLDFGAEAVGAHQRILSSVQAGSVLTAVGVAGVAFSGGFGDPEVRQGVLLLGAAVLAIGAGFLASSVIAYFLSKSWGLLEPATKK